MNISRAIFLFFMVWVFAFPGLVQAEGDFPFPIEPIKAALAERTISQGPESSMLTRSSWGPGMYRQTVDGVVRILVYWEINGQFTLVGEGSGVLVTSAGHIITNWHVVKDRPLVGQTIVKGQGSCQDRCHRFTTIKV